MLLVGAPLLEALPSHPADPLTPRSP